jgi:hypothetical protein
MEAFESFVALALEAEDFVVTGPVKFKISKKTSKKAIEEFQAHGYEVDLVGSRGDKLVLVSVKSFLGSGGVKPKEVTGEVGQSKSKGYMMLNDVWLRNEIVRMAAEKYGYKTSQVELRLYGGKYMGGEKGVALVKAWAAKQRVGAGPIAIFTGAEIAAVVLKMAESKTYRDNAVLMTVKVLLAAGMIKDLDQPISRHEDSKPLELKGTAMPFAEMQRRFPVGATVKSKKDGTVGVVLGHYVGTDKRTYLRLWVEGAERSLLRAATTMVLADQ